MRRCIVELYRWSWTWLPSRWLGGALAVWVQALLLGAAAPTEIRFHFKDPQPRECVAKIGLDANLPTSLNADWIFVHNADTPNRTFEIGSRVVLQIENGTSVTDLLKNGELESPFEIHPQIWVVLAPDAWIAAQEAERLSALPGVVACYPAPRFQHRLQDAYSAPPNDPLFPQQWHLENRATNGFSKGADINARAAWPLTRGENVVVAVVDNGIELTHPDLKDRIQSAWNFNFGDFTTNAGPTGTAGGQAHGTSVAGLIAATGNNQLGISGVAPNAQLSSWVIFDNSQLTPDTVGMKTMFESFSNVVQIQNHSWGSPGDELFPLPPLEDLGISNAITAGRNGLGVIMVRASNNARKLEADANADGYANDSRCITVAAIRSDGRAARYSNPGACVLVAAPSSEVIEGASSIMDTTFPSLVTTDLLGFNGANAGTGLGDSGDYRFGDTGFSGTSGATPIVSGIVALMLSANPKLSYRDVQQILILSSQPIDLKDPMIQTNGASLRVSYNVGFGVPNAALAVQQAKAWHSRPAAIRVTKTFAAPANGVKTIPDDGLRVEVTGSNIPGALASIPVTPSSGPHVDDVTPDCPLVPVDLANSLLQTNLSGKVGLCIRGGNAFTDKIQTIASAGAKWAIIYNNVATIPERVHMQGTDLVPIPAVMMGNTAGQALDQLARTNSTVRVRLHLQKVVCSVTVTNTMICEHVFVRLQTTHPRRGDLRVTLVSPSGTRSLLQRLNNDATAGPVDWTYHSVAHFFESTAGTWNVEVSDEEPTNTGSITRADLILTGVSIKDTDHDGLDDDWERSSFGSLAQTGGGDPDRDGWSNAAEQLLQTNPLAIDVPFKLDLAPWNSQIVRLSWPAVSGAQYRILASSRPEGPYTEVQTISSRFPITEWFAPFVETPSQVYRVEQIGP